MMTGLSAASARKVFWVSVVLREVAAGGSVIDPKIVEGIVLHELDDLLAFVQAIRARLGG